WAKIGFNPEDRFMVPIYNNDTQGGVLAVITQEGKVFGAGIVVNKSLEPVFQLSGEKIGSNPEDRFMVALNNIAGTSSRIVVITQAGNVFGADVAGKNIGPVFPFTGAKIGFSPEDRFMLAMNLPVSRLVVITQAGNVFGADVTGQNIGPVFQFTGS